MTPAFHLRGVHSHNSGVASRTRPGTLWPTKAAFCRARGIVLETSELKVTGIPRSRAATSRACAMPIGFCDPSASAGTMEKS